MEKKKAKKNNSIRRIMMRGTMILAIFLILGTSIAAGIQMFRNDIRTYEDYARAFAEQAAWKKMTIMPGSIFIFGQQPV